MGTSMMISNGETQTITHGFKMLFFRSFVITKGLLRDYFK